jgi:hypothetical protein
MEREFIVPGPNDLQTPYQQYLRQNLGQNLQEKHLDTYVRDCRSESPNSSSSAVVLSESLKCWLQGGKGRRVRLESMVVGAKIKEAERGKQVADLMEMAKHP